MPQEILRKNMSYLRFSLNLAIKQPIPQALQDKLPTIKARIQELKSYAEKINAGKDNEEMTIKAVYHICNHDTGMACGEEQDI